MLDFLICAGFAAVVMAPAILASVLQCRWHKEQPVKAGADRLVERQRGSAGR